MKDQDQLRKELSEPLPKEAVKPHPTKTYLSSIKAIYVTERLNTVFGIGKWHLSVAEIERGTNGTVVVKATIEIPDYGIHLESYGGNDNGGENSKNFDLGDAYKGATTDAITKIGSYLEIGIDVFKGLNSAPPANNTTSPANQAPELPWISEAQFKKVLERIQGGDKEALAGATKAFRMKKEYKEQLSTAFAALK
jgi:hypothetical protein